MSLEEEFLCPMSAEFEDPDNKLNKSKEDDKQEQVNKYMSNPVLY